MRLTRFTDYSLRVLIYLGQNNEGRVTIQQISDVYGISKNHLMKVVSNLTRLKLVAAQRGPGGGIQLNCAPEEIKLSEVIKNTEKHLSTKKPIKETETIDLTADTRVHGYLQLAMQAYLETLSRFTLADVLEPQVAEALQMNWEEKAA